MSSPGPGEGGPWSVLGAAAPLSVHTAKLTPMSDHLPPQSREIIGSARPPSTMSSSSPHASQYPPPPAAHDEHDAHDAHDAHEAHEAHDGPYAPMYASAPLLDGQPPRAPYPHEPAFPKLENINEVLQAQQAQQALHANHALIDARPPQHALSPAHAHGQQPKPNRLRKACDSCSIRKVKVSAARELLGPARALADHGHSATRPARRVEPVSPSRSHAPLNAPAAAGAPPIDTPKPSRSGASTSPTRTLATRRPSLRPTLPTLWPSYNRLTQPSSPPKPSALCPP